MNTFSHKLASCFIYTTAILFVVWVFYQVITEANRGF